MQKISIILLTLFIVCSCVSKTDQTQFSYEEAMIELQTQIKKMKDSDFKNTLLWKTQLIMEKDTFYRYNLEPNSYDSLKWEILMDEYMKYPMAQLDLNSLKELSINDGIEAYKFKYTRSFSKDFVVITISNQEGGRNTIKFQVFDRDRNCTPIYGEQQADGSCFRIRLNESMHLTNDEWQSFVKLIRLNKYWELPIKVDKQGYDGSDWIISGTRPTVDSTGVKSQIFKEVHRWTPDTNTSIYKIGNSLLEMNDYDWGEIY